MSAPPSKVVDHKNGDTLCNKRRNLRIVTVAENNQNLKIRRNNVSGYRGVCWRADAKKWRAYVTLKGKQQTIGYFSDVHEAGKAAREKRLELLPFAVN
jgi:hypothetical protein